MPPNAMSTSMSSIAETNGQSEKPERPKITVTTNPASETEQHSSDTAAIRLDDFELLRVIGRGSYAKVSVDLKL